MKFELSKNPEVKVGVGSVVAVDENVYVVTVDLYSKYTLVKLGSSGFVSDSRYGTVDEIIEDYFGKKQVRVIPPNKLILKEIN